MRRGHATAILLVLSTACAGAPRAGGSPACDAAWGHATRVLSAALDDYLAGMRRYAATRDGAGTGPAEARARARAAQWETARRGAFETVCRDWPEETRACVAAAASAPGLGDCAPATEALVISFTEEVVTAFAASPLR
jgi:peptidoglycan/LPS O-acetylase OafA/YrhL